MAILLGIDPGATTGWCAYDTAARAVIACGTFPEHHVNIPLAIWSLCILERPKGYGPTRPQMVDCGYVAGRLAEKLSLSDDYGELTRHEVCRILTDATHGEVRVRNDATAWAALVLLHGPDCDRRPKTKKGQIVATGGPLGSITSHARAALAVAVAWSLRPKEISNAK